MSPRLAAQLKAVGPSPFSRDITDRYWVEHRQGLNEGMATALAEASEGTRIAIVGAGRCQDVDLVSLVKDERIEHIDLFDLDEPSLHEGIAHARDQVGSIDNVSAIQLDVTGRIETFFEWMNRRTRSMPAHRQDPRTFKQERMHRWLEPIVQFWDDTAATSHIPEVHQGQYDLVVSDCILSQLMHAVEQPILEQLKHVMGAEKQKDKDQINQNVSAFWERVKVEVARGVGTAHFRNCASMVRPGGQLFIASDQATIHRYVVHRSTWEDYSRNPNIRDCLKEIHRMGELVALEGVERDPRFLWQGGNLEQMTRVALPKFEPVHHSQWVWNRQPYQLGNEEEDWQGEEVQAVLLRAPTQ